MESKDLASSLIDSLTDYDPAQITPDLVEVGLDHVLDDGIVKDIPFVRTFYAIYKTTVSLRDRAFVKKLLIFLSSLNSVSKEKRAKFKSRINADEKFKRKVGEQLLLILEHLDDTEKADLVAHAFQAYLDEHMNYETFLRIASAVDRSFLPDLKALQSAGNPNGLSPDARLNLSNSGIVELESTPSINLSARNNRYQITKLGKLILMYVIKK